MAKDYTKKEWKDHVVDSQTGKILQQGTPVSASNLNHLEDGIELAHQKLEGANRQTVSLKHGTQVINGDVNAPVSLQIDGRTLIPMQNSEAQNGNHYVLADKRTWLTFAGTVYKGIAKMTGIIGKPSAITRVANFEGKVVGSTLENPHIAKRTAGGPSGSTSLLTPYTFNEADSNDLNAIAKLDGTVRSLYAINIGAISQLSYSFNIVEEIERSLGKIPRNTVAEKVQWVKDNLAKLIFNWHGYGSGPSGNKVYLAPWRVASSSYSPDAISGRKEHTQNTITKMFIDILPTYSSNTPVNCIDSNGFVHFIAYTDATDGVTASTVYPDYAELEIHLNTGVILLEPRIPLFEVTKEEYDNILVNWNEDEVQRRYPSVEGVKHLQNPYIMAEGENLLPPFNEWSTVSRAIINGPYDIEMSVISTYDRVAYVTVYVLPNTVYRLDLEKGIPGTSRAVVRAYDKSGNLLNSFYAIEGREFNTGSAAYITVSLENTTTTSGNYRYFNPILTLGSVKKPFVPRNPSYMFAEAILGAIGTYKDTIFEQDGKMMLRKTIEKDLSATTSTPAAFGENFTGYKRFKVGGLSNINASGPVLGVKYNGKLLTYSPGYVSADIIYPHSSGTEISITVSNLDSGFAESYTPTIQEMQAYFNGWQVKTADGTTNKPTAWKSIVDGTDAPTQTLSYVSATKAAGYIPYKFSCVLAAPVISEVKTEGSISVNGLTQIEVGSGVIGREKFSITPGDSPWLYIADTGTGVYQQIIKNAPGIIIGIYKNGVKDNNWIIYSSNSNSQGLVKARCPKENYDTTAEYTISYVVYNRSQFTTNILNGLATFATNIRTALDDTVKKVEDVKTETSVNTLILYDVLKRLKAGGI